MLLLVASSSTPNADMKMGIETVSTTNYYWFHYDCPNILVPILVSEQTHVENPYMCADEGYNVCSRAYLPSDTETFLDNGSMKRRPTSNATVQIQFHRHCP